MSDNDYYDDFFKKQEKGEAGLKDIPIIRKMENDEKLNEEDLFGYLLMVWMGLIK